MRLTASVMLLFALAGAARAGEWKVIGTRAQGMGGAHVAVADDATASYWNPAAFAKLSQFELKIEAGVGLEVDPEMLESAEEIHDIILDMEAVDGQTFDQVMADINNGTATPAEIQFALEMVADGFRLLDGAEFGGVATANATVNTAFGRWGVGINMGATIEAIATVALSADEIALATGGTASQNVNSVFTDNGTVYSGGDPEEPLANDIEAIFLAGGVGPPATIDDPDALADDMVLQATLAGLDVTDPATAQILRDMATALVNTSGSQELVLDNATSIDVSGALLTEVVFTYGHPFADGKLCLGFNLKGIQGETYHRTLSYDEFEDAEEILDDILDSKNREQSTDFGLDVGILFQPFEKLRLGLVARNINGPEFDFEGGGTYEVDPQARFGVAVMPLKNWTIAADVDVTKNVIEGVADFETRFLSVGTEVRVARLLAIRAGANLNLEDPGYDEVYTVGLGIGAGGAFRLDIAAALAGDREDLDFDYDLAGFDLPSGLGLSVGFQISTKF